MSFNPKNLSYESNEPAFLQKLRGEYGGDGSGRHERPLARPRKQTTDGNDDDQPTYVVEDSQDTISKAEYEALVRKEEGSGDDENGKDKEASDATNDAKTGDEVAISRDLVQATQQVAGIGGVKKKRAIKAVGAEDEIEAPKEKRSKGKKGQKVKLSFDDA